MKTKHLNVAFEIKAVSDDGFFSGYGSVFEVLDSYREIVKPGAFLKSIADWTQKGRMPPVLWNHDGNQVIGVYTLMREDERGLYVEGQLLTDAVQKAREVHAALKVGAISGMSIGYTVVKAQDADKGVRRLTELSLWEISIVTFPANEAARVDAVKEALIEGNLPTLPEFEIFLREAGFSKSQATAVAGSGLSKLLRSESGTEASKSVSEALAILNT